MRWLRRWRYTRLESQLLELRATLTEVKRFVCNDGLTPDYIQEFIRTLTRDIGRIESKMKFLRIQGI